jgi:hypothetical protein
MDPRTEITRPKDVTALNPLVRIAPALNMTHAAGENVKLRTVRMLQIRAFFAAFGSATADRSVLAGRRHGIARLTCFRVGLPKSTTTQARRATERGEAMHSAPNDDGFERRRFRVRPHN